ERIIGGGRSFARRSSHRRQRAIDGGEPATERGHRTKLELRGARRRAALAVQHLDREPAEAIHHGEAVLVGRIVAGIDAAPAGEGGLVEKSGDRRALVAAARLELDHFAPKNDTELRLLHGEALPKARDAGAIGGRQAVVKGEAATLVLEKETR